MRYNAVFVLFVIYATSFTNAFFGGKKDKEEDKKISAKDSVALGVNMMMEAASDPRAMREAMEALSNDPATRREVEQMMADPAFRKEMEKMKSNPVMMNAIQGAKDMLDPQRAANIQSQMAAHQEEELSDAALGMQEMIKAAKNPKMLADAMEMMKDPETAAEVCFMSDICFISVIDDRHYYQLNRVLLTRSIPSHLVQVQAMMADPKFQAEMKKYTSSPAYKKAMSRASEDIEVMIAHSHR